MLLLLLLRFLFSSPLRYNTWLIPDSRTDDSFMLTSSPILLDGRRLSCTDTYSAMTCLLCTCTIFLWLCFSTPHVYKRPTAHCRNSKQVLFCTNTSCRRTCPFLILWNPILGEYPTSNPLSLEQLPCNRDLAIRVTTMHNIRTRLPNQRTSWTPISPRVKVAKPKRNTF